MDFNQLINQFQAEILSKGITPPDEIIDDAKINRFYIQGDKPRTKNGWYAFFRNSIACGAFGTWKEGITYKWCEIPFSRMNQNEYKEYVRQISEAKRLRDEEINVEQHNASQQAKHIWENAQIASTDHPYLINKKIQPFYARQSGKNLILPIIDIKGEHWSIQFISPTGAKWFLPNGAIKNHFIAIQHNPLENRSILICEGFATGATLASAYPDLCVIAACNAGNLKPVALEVRQHLPNVEMIIAADDDRFTSDNPGLKKAREAAIAAGAFFTKPQWPYDAPTSLTDFNDLACWLADDEVQYA